jgi:hypothetical protein
MPPKAPTGDDGVSPVFVIGVLRCVKYTAKNLTPNPFPPLPSPLLKGEGKGIMFLAGRGVRIKASLLVGERFGERSECTVSNREGL